MKNVREKNKEKKKWIKKKVKFFFLHLNLFHLFLFFYLKLNSFKMYKFWNNFNYIWFLKFFFVENQIWTKKSFSLIFIIVFLVFSLEPNMT